MILTQVSTFLEGRVTGNVGSQVPHSKCDMRDWGICNFNKNTGGSNVREKLVNNYQSGTESS